MKWRWQYIISVLMIPVLLLVCVRIYQTPHAEDIEQLFFEHREEFEQLAADLRKIADRNDPESGTAIIAEGYVLGSFVDRIGSLKYYSFGPAYSREEYDNIHSAVADIFSSLNLCGILFYQWSIEITISFSDYGNCRLFYLPYHSSDIIGYQIKEKIVLPGHWYAVVTED